MSLSVIEIIKNFRHAYEEDATKADRSQLKKKKESLYTEIEDSSWNFEVVHSSHELLHLLEERHEIVDLMKRYLLQSIPMKEEAWARWHLTDNLSMTGQHEEAVKTQKDFLSWARQILPCPEWHLPPEWPWDFAHSWRPSRKPTPANDCLLFRIWYDGTQSRSWLKTGKDAEWLKIFNDLMDEVPPSSANRVDRYYLLRTATHFLALSNRPQDAIQEVHKLDLLSQEDTNWEDALEVQIDARYVELEAYRILGELSEVRRIAEYVTKLLDEQYQNLSNLPTEKRKALRTMYHNLAAPVYRAQQYDLAIPLFQRAIELKIPTEYSYQWLAASLWATDSDRVDVLTLLKKGVSFSNRGQYLLSKAPELRNVSDDPEFVELLKKP